MKCCALCRVLFFVLLAAGREGTKGWFVWSRHVALDARASGGRDRYRLESVRLGGLSAGRALHAGSGPVVHNSCTGGCLRAGLIICPPMVFIHPVGAGLWGRPEVRQMVASSGEGVAATASQLITVIYNVANCLLTGGRSHGNQLRRHTSSNQ